jgi:hypothetical protein
MSCKGLRKSKLKHHEEKKTCRRKAKVVIKTRKTRICEERKTGERQKGER